MRTKVHNKVLKMSMRPKSMEKIANQTVELKPMGITPRRRNNKTKL